MLATLFRFLFVKYLNAVQNFRSTALSELVFVFQDKTC